MSAQGWGESLTAGLDLPPVRQPDPSSRLAVLDADERRSWSSLDRTPAFALAWAESHRVARRKLGQS